MIAPPYPQPQAKAKPQRFLIVVEMDAQTLYLNPKLEQQIRDGLASAAEYEFLPMPELLMLSGPPGFRVDGYDKYGANSQQAEVWLERLIEVTENVLTRVLVPVDQMSELEAV